MSSILFTSKIIRNLAFALPLISLTLAHCSLFSKNQDSNRETLLALLGLTQSTDNGSFSVDEKGGTFRSSDGLFKVTIPEGAMDRAQTFSIKRHNASLQAFPSGLPTSFAYEVEPSYSFKRPVFIEITLDTDALAHLGLSSEHSTVYSHSESGLHEETDDSFFTESRRLPGWSALNTEVMGDKVIATTMTFSIFGNATASGNNEAPQIGAGYYYFKPGCSRLPYRLRALVTDPDNDSLEVYLVTGESGKGSVLVPMTRQSGDWYEAKLPYEVMGADGLQMQILAIDANGANATLPQSGTFDFPEDGTHPLDPNYDPVDGNTGLNCAWVKDNPDGNPTDSDGDGIPDSHDSTPGGASTPNLTEYRIIPETVTMEPGESVTFGTLALDSGIPRVVTPGYEASNQIGELEGSKFTAVTPGSGSVISTAGSYTDTASIIVLDTIAPGDITDLAAIPVDHNRIELVWTATGDNGDQGQAQNYEVRYSTAPITDNAGCDTATGFSHALNPKAAGLSESLVITGLLPETVYSFCIRAIDGEGNRSQWMGSVSAQTSPAPDLTAPASIESPAALALSPYAIRLDWMAVGDDGLTGVASSYDIRRSTSSIDSDSECDSATSVTNSMMPLAPGAAESLTVTNLSDDTTYYFCIRAVDESGNKSPWNRSLSARTLDANDAPLVDAGPGSIVGPGHSAQLQGELTDPDAVACSANAANYVVGWSFVSVPLNSELINSDIQNRTTLNAHFYPDVSGDYVLELEVTDDPGSCLGNPRSDSDTVTITVNWDGLSFGTPVAGTTDSHQFGRFFWEADATDGIYLLWNLSNANSAAMGRYDSETGWTAGDSLSFGLNYTADLTIAGSQNLILAISEEVNNVFSLKTIQHIPGSGWQTTVEHPIDSGSQIRSLSVLGFESGKIRLFYVEAPADAQEPQQLKEMIYQPGIGWSSPNVLDSTDTYMVIMAADRDSASGDAVLVYYSGNTDLTAKRLVDDSWLPSENIGTWTGALHAVEVRIDSGSNIAAIWTYTTGEYPEWESTVRFSYFNRGLNDWTNDILLDETGTAHGRHYLSLSIADGVAFGSWQKLGTNGAPNYCDFARVSLLNGVETIEHIPLCREACVGSAPGGFGVVAYTLQVAPSYNKDFRVKRFSTTTGWGSAIEDFDQSTNFDVSLQNCTELPNDSAGRILVPWSLNNFSGGDTELWMRYLE